MIKIWRPRKQFECSEELYSLIDKHLIFGLHAKILAEIIHEKMDEIEKDPSIVAQLYISLTERAKRENR